MELNEYYNYLINNIGISEEVLKCITNINGYKEDTLNDILYYYTGCKDLEQYTEFKDIMTYDEYYGGNE